MADVMDRGFLRDSATGAIVVVPYEYALPPFTMHNGLLRDAYGALVVE